MFCTLSLNDQGFNIFSGDLYIDALILELFQICLAISKTLGENTL